jgi:intein/homing endonuclease
MLGTPEAQTPKAGKVFEIGQSAGKESITGEDLYYAIGLLLGDGCISAVPNKHCNTLHKRVTISSMDREILESFKKTIEEMFGCEAQIRHIPDHHVYEYGTSKGIVYDFFAENTAFKTKFPDDLRYATRSERMAFLAGLLDTDGFASFTHSPERIDKDGRIKKERSQFRMGFTNTRFIMEFTDLLDKLGIKYGEIWTNNHQTDFIKGRKVGKQMTRYTVPINAMSFALNGGYFNCIRKQERLVKYLRDMKSSYFEPHRLNAERVISAMV